MAADVPKLSPMGDILTSKEMWKRRVESIINMTSGVVYSIVMHSVIITAYALLIFRIFYINRFDLDVVDVIFSPGILFYLCFLGVEVGLKWFNELDPPFITLSGYWAHLLGCWYLMVYMYPSNRIESLIFGLVVSSLVFWTFFVFGAFVLIQSDMEVDSLTQPLV